MLLIYSEKKTNRLKYTFQTIFNDILGIDIEFTTDKDIFLKHQSEKLNYSSQPMGQEVFFCNVDLLFQVGISSFEVPTGNYNKQKVLFPVKDEASYLPFDPFAASFYLLSRYEEYLSHLKDIHGRYLESQSIAFNNRFLHQPVVNIWAYYIRDILLKKYPDIPFKNRKFTFIPTYDIDIAFSYKAKGLMRSLYGYTKDLLSGNFSTLSYRTAVLLGMKKDPYDTFSYQINLHKRYQLNPIYFILFGKNGPYDKNISINNSSFKELIKHLADYGEVGIHPSYDSDKNQKTLEKELKDLEKVLNQSITSSRQHFLKLNLPDTYHRLINVGIQRDYTMGYAGEIGFRAGICDPFYFYDLDNEVKTKLKIYPLTVMEGTLKDYLKVSTEEAESILFSLIDEVKKVDGTFISLWHNPSLNDHIKEGGWRIPYEKMIAYAFSNQKVSSDD